MDFGLIVSNDGLLIKWKHPLININCPVAANSVDHTARFGECIYIIISIQSSKTAIAVDEKLKCH